MRYRRSEWIVGEENYVEAVVGPGSRSLIGELASRAGYSSAFIVADTLVPRDMRRELESSLRGAGLTTFVLEVDGGEKAKSLEQLRVLWTEMLRHGVNRSTIVIANGGGSICDIAGFAAATYMRGVGWAAVPTTLLAMVDASIGGKTGINYNAKNLIGAYYHPRFIVADVEYLRTLSTRDYVSGLAEAVKHSILVGGEVLEWIESNRSLVLARRAEALTDLVFLSMSVKMSIVARDPREEKGERMLLNLGHTVGHAVEKATGYTLRHGEAVAMGIVVEAFLARRLLGLGLDDIERIASLLEGFSLPVIPPENLDPEVVLRAILFDKKRRGEKILLPLLRRIGDPVLVELDVGTAIRLLSSAWREALEWRTH